jgi:hypothetical protein
MKSHNCQGVDRKDGNGKEMSRSVSKKAMKTKHRGKTA